MMHGPSTVAGRPATFDLWGGGSWYNQDVVGESHHLHELRELVGRLSERHEEREYYADLVPELDNRYDPAAVAVHIEGHRVGYLPREIAASYGACLAELRARGLVARVRARVWAGLQSDYGVDKAGHWNEQKVFNASVSLALAEPHLCLPVNEPPAERYQVLPEGAAIQISGEDQCMAAIVPHLRAAGESFVYATLHELSESTTRTTKELVEVRVDGARVGQLTPKMSGDLLPAVRHLAADALVTVVKAKIKGNRLKAEITVHAARAHELPVEWPEASVAAPERTMSAAAHAPVPPRPTRIRFAPAPGWPAPPDGWEPPPGWMPDPAWPPAPPGWQFWVME